MKKQIHVYYIGRVQGVGFRFSVENTARNLGISGWVKNLRDERVEILAEAEESILKEFLLQINKRFSSYIQDIDIDWLPTTDKFQDFVTSY